MKALDLIRRLRANGIDANAILDAVEGMEEERLAKDRAKTAKYRNNKKNRHVTTVTPVTLVTRARVEGSSSSSETTGHKQDSSLRSQCAREEDTPEFMEFWLAYPNKVGKPDARLKFQKALEKAGLADILAGLQRYIRDKPVDRSWCNPATFLHQERWNDQPLYANDHARPNGTGPPRKLRGSAALSELASRPFHEVFGNIFDEPSVNAARDPAARNGR